MENQEPFVTSFGQLCPNNNHLPAIQQLHPDKLHKTQEIFGSTCEMFWEAEDSGTSEAPNENNQ